MQRSKLAALATVLVASVFVASVFVFLPSVGQAQLMVDMSKVTCGQYIAMPPDQSRIFSAWMSGWFNQKTGYVWVNLNAYARNVQNVKSWCAANPQELVMTGLARSAADMKKETP